jgi:arylsulfatase A-like enzyme
MKQLDPAAPLNVLLLWTDQQRPDTIGAYGTPQARTPNLDRLAERSVLFEQAYCTQPVCSPSRASVLTGLYPHTHGVLSNGTPLPLQAPTLAELLRPAGYTSGYVGKWHLGRERTPQRGFEAFWSSTEEYRDGYAVDDPGVTAPSSYQNHLRGEGRRAQLVEQNLGREVAARRPEELGKPAFQAREALRFLEAYRERPFFLSVNFLEPHPPYFGPWDGLFREEDMTLPKSWYAEMEHSVPLRFRMRREYMRDQPGGHKGRLRSNDESGWKDLKARYWSNCALVDKYVGVILRGLDEMDLAQRTIVVYTSDHGDMMGDHGLLAKGTPYEGSVRVPLIMRIPGQQPARVSAPVSLVHLVPTLLAGLEQPVPAHVQGSDLGPLIAGEALPDDVVIEWNGYLDREERDGSSNVAMPSEPDDVARRLEATEVRTIRHGKWKLNVHLSGEHELYDLDADPDELHNALRDQGRDSVIRELFVRLQRWQAATGDSLGLPEPM